MKNTCFFCVCLFCLFLFVFIAIMQAAEWDDSRPVGQFSSWLQYEMVSYTKLRTNGIFLYILTHFFNLSAFFCLQLEEPSVRNKGGGHITHWCIALNEKPFYLVNMVFLHLHASKSRPTPCQIKNKVDFFRLRETKLHLLFMHF